MTRMRLAYVCRDLAPDTVTGPGAQVFATAQAMAQAGHEVYLVSAAIAAARSRSLLSSGSPRWVRVEDTRPDHRYFSDQQAYADRVYDALRRLHDACPLDVVEFVDAGGEALTVLRAKRLLGEFPRTRIAVVLNPWSSAAGGPDGHRPGIVSGLITAFAERYCREHADVLVADSRRTAQCAEPSRAPVALRPPGPVPGRLPRPRPARPAAARTVLHLGTVRPGSGVDVFLRAAELLLAQQPGFRFVVRGEDTATDPFGRSYWQHLLRGLAPEVRGKVVFGGPVRSRDLGSLPPAGTQCVLPEAATECPTTALLAMALGYVITAREASTAAELVRDGANGRIVPPADPVALAAALLAAASEPEHSARLAEAAAEHARTEHGQASVAAALSAAYRVPAACRAAPPRRTASPRRASVPPRAPAAAGAPPSCLVSVVIPLFNQGRYLLPAVESIRRADYPQIEIVVVDDGSTDPETIAAFDALQGVTKLRQRNGGLSAARNAGIARAHGRYVVPLDADDALPTRFVGSAVAAMQRNPRLGYVTGYLRYFELLDFVHVPVGHVPGLSLILNTHARATGLFRRDVLDELGGYDEGLPAYEDWDLYIRLHKAGYESDVLPIEGHLYRRHHRSMTFNTSAELRSELLQHLLRKHADTLTDDRLLALLLTVVHLWKTQYEPSASVRLQHGCQPATDGPGAPRDVRISQAGE
jgi:GT2 family glycosyltransferase/glycosyltransferase involved in cell wall biosynthesis